MEREDSLMKLASLINSRCDQEEATPNENDSSKSFLKNEPNRPNDYSPVAGFNRLTLPPINRLNVK